MADRVIRVPLAVDAQVRVPVGFTMLPIRTVILLLAVSPLAILFLSIPLDFTFRFGFFVGILLLAGGLSVPVREGVWIGTWFAYRLCAPFLANTILRGTPQRGSVKSVGDAIHVSATKPIWTPPRQLAAWRSVTGSPRAHIVGPGLFRLTPGGGRAILALEGPASAINSDGYLAWCHSFMGWLLSLDCSAQFITVTDHYDSSKANAAFDQRTATWPNTNLRDVERDLAGEIAQQSLGLRHYVVLSPGLAGKDGIPPLSKITKFGSIVEATDADAQRTLESALRIAEGFAVDVSIPTSDDLSELLTETIVGAHAAVVGDDFLHIGDQHHIVMTATKLPPRIEAGVVVNAIMRAHMRGITSLHILPVDAAAARKIISRQLSVHKYAVKQGYEQVDSEVAVADTTSVLAAIAQRDIAPCRVALTISLHHHERSKVSDAAEQLVSVLEGHGFEMERATRPGFIPAAAFAPGSAPLGRSLQLTSDSVALRMLPALGTPFSKASQPLIGINALTRAPAYFSVWDRPNHNLVIVGSSGAGKSMATKTMLIRHVMEGVSAVVIDPDSEYEPVMAALGGSYFELGTDALNPLAAGMGVPPDTAASLILPVISVLSGDEKGIRDGRPIRRLPDEDQGWVHAEIADFYRTWEQTHGRQEPVMHNLVDFIDTQSAARALTPNERERCRIITARLRRFTQGQRATVFDRPSTFTVGAQPVAIGLRVFAMSYGADLTPALACVLTSILAAMERREGRMIIVVDEAHRVTSDPDAGEVLGQLVRQARKYGAGVWMCSQKVEDFVNTELGKTLAATAATKLVLGTEEASLENVLQVFKLQEHEGTAINPMVQGRGVLLSGADRTVVQVVPGQSLMLLCSTSADQSEQLVKELLPTADETGAEHQLV